MPGQKKEGDFLWGPLSFQLLHRLCQKSFLKSSSDLILVRLNLRFEKQAYYFVLDSIFIKSIQSDYFHEIRFGKVDGRRERRRPMIRLEFRKPVTLSFVFEAYLRYVLSRFSFTGQNCVLP